MLDIWIMLGIIFATLLVLYAATSYILFRKPSMIHKKKQIAFKCRHISHRGGAGENIENTMTAFRFAVDQCETDMLELDCQLTGDGEVVVSHDDHLLRACGVENYISNMSYNALPEYLPSLPLDFNKDILCESKSSDLRIPLLSEVFEAFPRTPINIDIKRNDPQLIEKVACLIEEYEREDITAWGNFDDVIITQCYHRNCTIPVYFSMRRALLMCMWFYTGLLPFVPLRESLFEIVMPSIFINSDNTVHKPTVSQRIMLTVTDWLLMRKSLFNHLQRRGIQIYVWVLNDDSEYRRALSFEVDGIMTDFPTKLRQFLNKYEKE